MTGSHSNDGSVQQRNMLGKKQSDIWHVRMPSHETITHIHDKNECVGDRGHGCRQASKEQACFAALEESLDSNVSHPSVHDDYIGSIHGTHKRRARNCVSYDIAAVAFSECWYATIWVGDILVEALVDSGAEMSLLSSDIYEQLANLPDYNLQPTNTCFLGIGGSQYSLGLSARLITKWQINALMLTFM